MRARAISPCATTILDSILRTDTMKKNRSNWLGVNRRVRKAHLKGNFRKAAHYGLKSFNRFKRWYKS